MPRFFFLEISGNVSECLGTRRDMCIFGLGCKFSEIGPIRNKSSICSWLNNLGWSHDCTLPSRFLVAQVLMTIKMLVFISGAGCYAAGHKA